MFKLIIKNKSTGQTEQSDFKTQAECETHKEYLKTIGYNFDDIQVENPAFDEIVKEAWTEEIQEVLDENGVLISPAQTIVHDAEIVHHEVKIEIIQASHSFEIIEDQKSEKLAKIAELEAKITPRRLRDALLGDKSFVEQIEAEIKAIRDSL